MVRPWDACPKDSEIQQSFLLVPHLITDTYKNTLNLVAFSVCFNVMVPYDKKENLSTEYMLHIPARAYLSLVC